MKRLLVPLAAFVVFVNPPSLAQTPAPSPATAALQAAQSAPLTLAVLGKPDAAGKPRIEFSAADGLPFDVLISNNTDAEVHDLALTVDVLDDAGKPVMTAPTTEKISANKTLRKSVHFDGATLVPGIYTVVAHLKSGDAPVLTAQRKFIFDASGIGPSTLPIEAQRKAFQPKLDAFWKSTIADGKNTPIGGTATLDEKKSTDKVKVYKVSYNSYKGETTHAWLVVPTSDGPHPGLVLLPGFGNSAIEPPVFLAESGFVAIAMNVHEADVDASSYAPVAATYMQGGLADPHTFVYRRMVTAGLRAVDYLAQRPEVSADHIGVVGVSQGGGLAIMVAALDPRIKAVVASSPAADFPRMVATGPDNPVKPMLAMIPPAGATQLNETMQYFEPTLLAERIRVPTLITVGLLDTVVPPTTAYALKNSFTPGVPVIMNIAETGVHGVTEDQEVSSLSFLKKFLG